MISLIVKLSPGMNFKSEVLYLQVLQDDDPRNLLEVFPDNMSS